MTFYLHESIILILTEGISYSDLHRRSTAPRSSRGAACIDPTPPRAGKWTPSFVSSMTPMCSGGRPRFFMHRPLSPIWRRQRLSRKKGSSTTWTENYVPSATCLLWPIIKYPVFFLSSFPLSFPFHFFLVMVKWTNYLLGAGASKLWWFSSLVSLSDTCGCGVTLLINLLYYPEKA